MALLQGVVLALDMLKTAELYSAFNIIIVHTATVIDDGQAGHVGQRQAVFMSFEISIQTWVAPLRGQSTTLACVIKNPHYWLVTVHDRSCTGGAPAKVR